MYDSLYNAFLCASIYVIFTESLQRKLDGSAYDQENNFLKVFDLTIQILPINWVLINNSTEPSIFSDPVSFGDIKEVHNDLRENKQTNKTII